MKYSHRNSQTPWSYRKGNGLLYRIPAGLKLIGLLLFSTLIFIIKGPFLLIIAITVIILSLNSGINPRELLKGGRPLLVLCVFIVLVRTFQFAPFLINRAGLLEGCLFSLTMIISFTCGALFFAATTMGEINKSLSAAETFFHLDKIKISLGISLMLKFIPDFFEVWEEIELAWQNRGGKNNIQKYISLLPRTINKLMEKAAQTADALESRGI